MPLSPERNREYQREYARKRRSLLKETTKQLLQTVVDRKGPKPQVNEEAMLVGQAVLRQALNQANLELNRVIGKVSDKLEATRHFNGKEDTILTQDNDAQLRAAELAIRLHERAGTIPTVNEQGNMGGSGVAIHFHVHRGNFTRADQTIDGQVIESKAIGE